MFFIVFLETIFDKLFLQVFKFSLSFWNLFRKTSLPLDHSSVSLSVNVLNFILEIFYIFRILLNLAIIIWRNLSWINIIVFAYSGNMIILVLLASTLIVKVCRIIHSVSNLFSNFMKVVNHFLPVLQNWNYLIFL